MKKTKKMEKVFYKLNQKLISSVRDVKSLEILEVTKKDI